MTTILAVDPGPVRSAWALYVETSAGYEVRGHAIQPNVGLLGLLRSRPMTPYYDIDVLVIEKIESFGMAVGAEVFETVYWSGQFAEAAHPLAVARLTRRAVKLHLCGSARAKDGNIRQALIDRFGGPDAIGRKATPGPLHGVAGDVWSALAVAVTYADGVR